MAPMRLQFPLRALACPGESSSHRSMIDHRLGFMRWTAALVLVACGGGDPGGGMASGTSSSSSSTDATTGSTTNVPTTGGVTSDATTTTDPTTGATTTTTTDSTGAATTTDPSTGAPGTTTGGESTSSSTGVMDTCNDGVLDDGEACDTDDLAGQTCGSQGFDGGTLACSDTCIFDTQGCTVCGDGMLDPGEDCDDGNTDPGDGCDATCQIEACDPDGVYAIQGPAIAYTCCVGLVDVNINAFTLSADGATIASSPSNPVALTGAATTCPDGDFKNMGAIAGSCTETYAVSGMFTDKDTWTGQYTLTFTGNQCDCFNGQLGTPCINQTFPITAKR